MSQAAIIAKSPAPSTERRRTPRVLLVAALVVWVIQALAWPLGAGRTGGIQVLYYLDFWNDTLVQPALIGYPPVAPFVFTPVLQWLGPWAVEALLAACFVAAISWTYRAAALWGRGLATVVACALLAHASYGSLFHRIDSDALFAAGFAGWLCYAVSHARRATSRTYAIHGLIVALLVLTRPSNQAFFAFAVVPLFISATPVHRRVLHAITFFLSVGALLGAWALVNQARFGQTGSRFGNAAPLYGLMMNTRSISPANGPASTALTAVAQGALLSHERYRGIDADTFFRDGGSRAWEALVALSDREWGWDSRYQVLRDTAIETIRRNPGEYALTVARVFLHTFILRYTYPVQDPPGSPAASPAPPGAGLVTRMSESSGRVQVPPADTSWNDATPDRRYANGASDAPRDRLGEQYRALMSRSFGYRYGVPDVAAAVNGVGTLFVPMLIALLLGVMGLPLLAVSRDMAPAETTLGWMLAMSIVLLMLSAALQPPTLEYRLPLDPLFILSALVGARAMVRGRRSLLRQMERSR
jgi:hypothetical protein